MKANKETGCDFGNARAVLTERLPEDFVIQFRARKPQWPGFFGCALMPDAARPNGESITVSISGNKFDPLMHWTDADPVELALPRRGTYEVGATHEFQIIKRGDSLTVFLDE